MEYMTVIKVLRGMNSVFDHGAHTLQYLPYQWVTPSVGKIYAFQNYERALRWIAEYHDLSVWEAEAEIFKAGSCMMCTSEDSRVVDFWQWYLAYLKGESLLYPLSLSAAYTPNGTILCNKLRITNKYRDFY